MTASRVKPRPWVQGEQELPLALGNDRWVRADTDGSHPELGRTYLGISVLRGRDGSARVHLTTQPQNGRRVLTTLLALVDLHTSTDKELIGILHEVVAALEDRLESGQMVD